MSGPYSCCPASPRCTLSPSANKEPVDSLKFSTATPRRRNTGNLSSSTRSQRQLKPSECFCCCVFFFFFRRGFGKEQNEKTCLPWSSLRSGPWCSDCLQRSPRDGAAEQSQVELGKYPGQVSHPELRSGYARGPAPFARARARPRMRAPGVGTRALS